MTRLGVNVDHVATLREARRALEPDPVTAALLAELAGADGIVAHLRMDRRHIKEHDLRRLRESLTTKLDLEMAASSEMIEIALEVKPDIVTLVPERPQEITTEGGLDLKKHRDEAKAAIEKLKREGIRVSLFLDPDGEQIRLGRELGADMVEINTGRYAEAAPKSLEGRSADYRRELEKIQSAAELAAGLGFAVLAGHGLTYRNVKPIADIPQIEELNIGHNIIARAALVGIERAVREMLAIVKPGAGGR